MLNVYSCPEQWSDLSECVFEGRVTERDLYIDQISQRQAHASVGIERIVAETFRGIYETWEELLSRSISPFVREEVIKQEGRELTKRLTEMFSDEISELYRERLREIPTREFAEIASYVECMSNCDSPESSDCVPPDSLGRFSELSSAEYHQVRPEIVNRLEEEASSWVENPIAQYKVDDAIVSGLGLPPMGGIPPSCGWWELVTNGTISCGNLNRGRFL